MMIQQQTRVSVKLRKHSNVTAASPFKEHAERVVKPLDSFPRQQRHFKLSALEQDHHRIARHGDMRAATRLGDLDASRRFLYRSASSRAAEGSALVHVHSSHLRRMKGHTVRLKNSSNTTPIMIPTPSHMIHMVLLSYETGNGATVTTGSAGSASGRGQPHTLMPVSCVRAIQRASFIRLPCTGNPGSVKTRHSASAVAVPLVTEQAANAGRRSAANVTLASRNIPASSAIKTDINGELDAIGGLLRVRVDLRDGRERRISSFNPNLMTPDPIAGVGAAKNAEDKRRVDCEAKEREAKHQMVPSF